MMGSQPKADPHYAHYSENIIWIIQSIIQARKREARITSKHAKF
jgi:hypothetical protein